MRYIYGVILMLMLHVPYGLAKDLNLSRSVTYDKSSPPAIFQILNYENFGAPFNGANTIPTNVNGMVCGSESDTQYGACPTRLTETNRDFETYPGTLGFGQNIKLRFTSVELGTTRDITLKSFYGNGCYRRYMTYYAVCQANSPAGLSLGILAQELGGMPRGTWRGTLMIYQRNSEKSNVNLGTWRLDITLSVNDARGQQIYFPQYPNGLAQVNIPLQKHPGTYHTTTVSGDSWLDMCLYDGSNSSSSRISLLFQDEGAAAGGRPAGQFSIYLDGADKTQPGNRIDYILRVMNPITNRAQEISNGSEIVWTGTNNSEIQRPVSLPGVPGTSLCVPAPIYLSVPSFRLADKAAGHFVGKLRIIYTPSTQTGLP